MSDIPVDAEIVQGRPGVKIRSRSSIRTDIQFAWATIKEVGLMRMPDETIRMCYVVEFGLGNLQVWPVFNPYDPYEFE